MEPVPSALSPPPPLPPPPPSTARPEERGRGPQPMDLPAGVFPPLEGSCFSLVDPASPKIPAGRWMLVLFIGSGSFGDVYLAVPVEHVVDDEYADGPEVPKVAVKVSNHVEAARHEYAVQARLPPEAPHVIHTHGLVEVEGGYATGPFHGIVLDYCPEVPAVGGPPTLTNLLEYYRAIDYRLSAFDVLMFFTQLITAEFWIRGVAVIQRDLKARGFVGDNIFFKVRRADKEPMPDNVYLFLGDFGFGIQLGPDSMTASPVGTPETAAPEVLRGDAYGANSEVWSLFVVLYQICFGTVPYQIGARNLRELYQRLPRTPNEIPFNEVVEDGRLVRAVVARTVGPRKHPADWVEADPLSDEFVAILRWMGMFDPEVRATFPALFAEPFVRSLRLEWRPRLALDAAEVEMERGWEVVAMLDDLFDSDMTQVKKAKAVYQSMSTCLPPALSRLDAAIQRRFGSATGPTPALAESVRRLNNLTALWNDLGGQHRELDQMLIELVGATDAVKVAANQIVVRIDDREANARALEAAQLEALANDTTDGTCREREERVDVAILVVEDDCGSVDAATDEGRDIVARVTGLVDRIGEGAKSILRKASRADAVLAWANAVTSILDEMDRPHTNDGGNGENVGKRGEIPADLLASIDSDESMAEAEAGWESDGTDASFKTANDDTCWDLEPADLLERLVSVEEANDALAATVEAGNAGLAAQIADLSKQLSGLLAALGTGAITDRPVAHRRVSHGGNGATV